MLRANLWEGLNFEDPETMPSTLHPTASGVYEQYSTYLKVWLHFIKSEQSFQKDGNRMKFSHDCRYFICCDICRDTFLTIFPPKNHVLFTFKGMEKENNKNIYSQKVIISMCHRLVKSYGIAFQISVYKNLQNTK